MFPDVQVGHSTVQEELPALAGYLSRPQVHLGIDPEYSMKGGEVPCSVIGTLDAEDVNYAIQFLTALVKQHQLPPKILVVHRFTRAMLTNYRNIHVTPEVQLVVNMDGFGFPAKRSILILTGWRGNRFNSQGSSFFTNRTCWINGAQGL
ncbi:hypothetical protein MKQ70_20080 [Chitinophaga sedimenti]|uniref:hypothetical protein n=1 Tax=Chitinophaga sedimenti TaxID=2033606 RepID=UPI0020052961|nr:hypothetical protein [Chitinophaga sedimenti]MCK7557177.1 hypothetical protein [Chitinophaga sedimenti]